MPSKTSAIAPSGDSFGEAPMDLDEGLGGKSLPFDKPPAETDEATAFNRRPPERISAAVMDEKEDEKEAEDAADEFDELTVDELRSLLDNFKNLSKGEQLDLIQYMKKLEASNPAKVRMLKQPKG